MNPDWNAMSEYRVRIQDTYSGYRHDAMAIAGTPLPQEGDYLEGLAPKGDTVANVGQVTRVDSVVHMIDGTAYLIPRIWVVGLRQP